MTRCWRLPRCTALKNACASRKDCWAARQWRSSCSGRRSIWRGQKTDVAVALTAARRYSAKTIAETLGVARSNLIERRDGTRPKRRPQDRSGDRD